MPLQLDAATQNISTPAGDSGTYTWADVVALGSTKLVTLADTNGRTIYRWRGLLTIQDPATLNILNVIIELLGIDSNNPGRIQAIGSGTINFGEEATVNGEIIQRSGCTIIITRFYRGSNYVDRGGLSHTNTTFTATGSTINLYATTIRFAPTSLITTGTKRHEIFIRRAKNCLFHSEDGSANSGSYVYFRESCDIDSITLVNSNLEFTGISTSFSNARSIGAQTAYVNYTNTRIAVRDATAIGALTAQFDTNQKSALDFVNGTIDLSKGLVRREDPLGTRLESRKLITIYPSVTQSGVAVQDALITYTGRSIVSGTTNSSGLIGEIQLVVAETNTVGMTYPVNNVEFFATPLLVADYSSYTLEVRSYAHEPLVQTTTLSSALGSAIAPFNIGLVSDTGVTQANASTVAAYTGISHTATTITVTQARTLDEIYDSRKLYWRNNSGVNPPYKESDVFNLGGANLVIDGITLVPSSKFNFIETTGTVTFLNNGDATVSIEDSTGVRVALTVTNLVIDSELVIRVSGSSAVVHRVDSTSTTARYLYQFTGSEQLVDVVAIKEGYQFFKQKAVTLGGTNQSIRAEQVASTAWKP